MTDTDITSSATAYPLDPGYSGVTSAQRDSAADLAAMVTHVSGAYVRQSELQFNQVDTTNDQVDVGTGRAFVLVSGVDMQSGTQSNYDMTLQADVAVGVDVVSEIVDLGLASSAVNDLWLAVDLDGSTTGTEGGVYIRHGGGLSAPSDPNVKLGTVDTSDGSTTRPNDGSSLSLRNLTVTNNGDFGSLSAETLIVDGFSGTPIWKEESGSPHSTTADAINPSSLFQTNP